MSLGPWEIAFIFLAILLLFGAKRIPEIARGLGKGIREFKDATNDIKQELNVTDTTPRQVPQQTQYVAPPQAVPPPAQHAAPAPPVAPPAEGQALSE
ncbi:Sec-independent protein translocase subunit TatA/TatB [Rubricoccus marinus]|uniref:Sec-independent protein translocase subunit TatA/TatB n=1 Tax=Rubricoccus marinus TaxID=716817 RepID=UPI000B985DF0|nr:twin-arginine translocase TatA/TatE family subunit [Rubricoccus marinus]